jgi:hypothetical protein
MSTKCSLAWGKKFHAYTDCLEKHAFVHVEITGAEFDASPGQVTVRIPMPIWEHIRTYSPARYDLADLTDGELRQLARKRAAAKKKMMLETAPPSPLRPLLTLSCSPDAREIFRELRAQRKAQQKLRAEVELLRKQNDASTEIRSRLTRRKRILLPEYKRLMARPSKGGRTQQALDEIRGGR